ncbi:MAG: hypothetical protein KKH44_04555 [Bacteroidetes bacterium]|nr:hypothetical protein [Bacteroidota bacterium]
MANCTELAQIFTDIAMNIGSRPDMVNIDKVLKEIQKDFPDMRRTSLTDFIVEATTTERKKQTLEQERLSNLKQEAKLDYKIRKSIEKYEEYLKKGTLPEVKRLAKQPEEIQLLQNIRNNLRKQLTRSEPAVKERLEKSIAELERRIESGDILPKAREEIKLSEELENLQIKKEMLQRSIRMEINRLRPKSVFEKYVASPFNLARSVITSMDLSAVFRQGGFIVLSHPVRSFKAIPKMIKAAVSDKGAYKINQELKNRKNANLYSRDGLYMPDNVKLSQREEVFATDLIDRISEKNKFFKTLIFPVKASERAYTTFLKVLRADSYDAMVNSLSADGNISKEQGRAIANFINVATGRGDLGAMEKHATALNTLFFAPKYTASRFQLLTKPLTLAFGPKETAQVRKMIALEYVRYLTGLGVVYGLGALAGGEFEDDPTSADFGKIRFGKTRLDPLSGMAQSTVLLSRLSKDAITAAKNIGKEEDEKEERKTAETLGRFTRYKLSPMAGTAWDIISGEKPFDELTPYTVGRDLIVPLSFREITEVMQEQGMSKGTAFSLLATFGMGMQTYESIKNWDNKRLNQAIKNNTIQKGFYDKKTRTYRKSGTPHKGRESYVQSLREEYKKRNLNDSNGKNLDNQKKLAVVK